MVQQVSRVRRVRTRGARTARITASAKLKAMEDSLKSIAKKMVDLDYLASEVEKAQAELLEQMQEAGISEVEVDKALAEITRSAGRAVNTIDPKGYFNAVTRDEFFASISVSNTEAKKYLPEKALTKITSTKPGTPGPEVLKIKLKKNGS